MQAHLSEIILAQDSATVDVGNFEALPPYLSAALAIYIVAKFLRWIGRQVTSGSLDNWVGQKGRGIIHNPWLDRGVNIAVLLTIASFASVMASGTRLFGSAQRLFGLIASGITSGVAGWGIFDGIPQVGSVISGLLGIIIAGLLAYLAYNRYNAQEQVEERSGGNKSVWWALLFGFAFLVLVSAIPILQTPLNWWAGNAIGFVWSNLIIGPIDWILQNIPPAG